MIERSNDDQALIQNIRNITDREIDSFCAGRMAALAVDTSYTGFQDPRVAAHIMLENLHGQIREIKCSFRNVCKATVETDFMNDTSTIDGTCIDIGSSCLQDAWSDFVETRLLEDHTEADNAFEAMNATGKIVGTNDQIGHVCLQFDCHFSGGMTAAGHIGSAGECVKQKEKPITSSSFVETPVEIRRVRQ